MGKWDGRFKESKYKETGNLVNNVIENDGRILHESTTDGFTHEIVDRGSYISEDYYFPHPSKKGKHIHYELRSSGEILVDGKVINKKAKGDNNMAMRRVRSQGMNLGRHLDMDYDNLDSGAGDQVEEGTRLHELAEKFNGDKKKLEDEIDKVQASNISSKDKARLIQALENAIQELQDQYENEVVEEQEKVQEEITEQIETMDAAADELDQQADSLRGVTMDAASTDAQAAADEAEAKKQEFIAMRDQYAEKLRLQMEQAEMMKREIRTRRLRGR